MFGCVAEVDAVLRRWVTCEEMVVQEGMMKRGVYYGGAFFCTSMHCFDCILKRFDRSYFHCI